MNQWILLEVLMTEFLQTSAYNHRSVLFWYKQHAECKKKKKRIRNSQGNQEAWIQVVLDLWLAAKWVSELWHGLLWASFAELLNYALSRLFICYLLQSAVVLVCLLHSKRKLTNLWFPPSPYASTTTYMALQYGPIDTENYLAFGQSGLSYNGFF